MAYKFYTSDVFTKQRFGGNPLAVFPDARGLSSEQMQTIAREFNLSETVFIFPPSNPANSFALRIFTPASELPFAGHPTVGAALMLLELGMVQLEDGKQSLQLEEQVGLIRVDISAEEGHLPTAILTAAKLPEVGPPPPSTSELTQLLSLADGDIVEGEFAPEAVSCGVGFLFVPVRDLAALGRARMNVALWEQLLKDYWAPHTFVFTTKTGQEEIAARARMFGPAIGISEDPATGAAASAFAGYLAARSQEREGTLNWTIRQGIEMGRPSTLYLAADLRDGAVSAVRVGGNAVLVSEGLFHI